jgi:hypothetical protein
MYNHKEHMWKICALQIGIHLLYYCSVEHPISKKTRKQVTSDSTRFWIPEIINGRGVGEVPVCGTIHKMAHCGGTKALPA